MRLLMLLILSTVMLVLPFGCGDDDLEFPGAPTETPEPTQTPTGTQTETATQTPTPTATP